MPRTGAQNRGIQRERDLCKRLEADGWFAVRMPGSMGTFDVLASKPYGYERNLPRLAILNFYEVKSTQAGPYAGFGPADRQALLETATKAGAEAFLCWWPKNKQPQFIPSSEWPNKVTRIDANTLSPSEREEYFGGHQ